MYEDLEQIAQLKFGKEMESISGQTREKVAEMQNEYAAHAPFPGARSGPHEAAVGQVYIDGTERLVRALYKIWVNLIKQRKGHISRSDVEFIAGKVGEYARTQKGHLETVFRERRMGPAKHRGYSQIRDADACRRHRNTTQSGDHGTRIRGIPQDGRYRQ